MFVRDPHDRLHLLHGRRADDAGRKVGGGAGELERVLKVGQGPAVNGDLVVADRCDERRESTVEVGLGEAWWNRSGDVGHGSGFTPAHA